MTNAQPTFTPNCTPPKNHMLRDRASRPTRRTSDSSGLASAAAGGGTSPGEGLSPPAALAPGVGAGGRSRTSSQNTPATTSPHSPYTTNTPRQLVAVSPGSGGTAAGVMTHSATATPASAAAS